MIACHLASSGIQQVEIVVPIWQTVFQVVLPLVSVVAGALLGAFIASKYQDKRDIDTRAQQQRDRDRDREDGVARSAIQIQFTLIRQLNVLVWISREFSGAQDQEQLSYAVSQIDLGAQHGTIDANDLTFVLESKQSELAADLMLYVECFEDLSSAISKYRRFLDTEVSPVIKQLISGAGSEIDWSKPPFVQLGLLAKEVVEVKNVALDRNTDCFRRFRDFLEAEYPSRKFLNLSFSERVEAALGAADQVRETSQTSTSSESAKQ